MTSINRKRLGFRIPAVVERLDPHMFYEYAVNRAMLESTGLELFLYRLMGPALIRSFACAIDPLGKFRTYGKIASISRRRERSTLSAFDRVRVRSRRWYSNRHTIPNWNGVTGQNSPFLVSDPPVTEDSTGNRDYQYPLPWRSGDTTRRTRPLGSDLGEFEKQKLSLTSPGRTVRRVIIVDSRVLSPNGDNDQINISRDERMLEIYPSAATLSQFTYNNFRLSELDLAHDLISKNVVSMVAKTSLYNRNTSLLRNVVELKDMPRSIASLQKTMADLRKLGQALGNKSLDALAFSSKQVAKDVPNEYLSYIFGWRQAYRDLMELLSAPDRMAKQVNYLLRASGRETTFRQTLKVTPPTSDGVSGFWYESVDGEYDVSVRSAIHREAELKLVIRATYDFPPLMQPNFNRELFLEKIGLVPRLSDVYELTPWSWLFDWFTGLGDYISHIENINSDPKLVNYAMITCNLTSKLVTNYRSKSDSPTLRVWVPTGSVDSHNITDNTHESIAELKTQVRKEVGAGLAGLRQYTDMKSLTTYQQSVLGALSLQRSHLSRRK